MKKDGLLGSEDGGKSGKRKAGKRKAECGRKNPEREGVYAKGARIFLTTDPPSLNAPAYVKTSARQAGATRGHRIDTDSKKHFKSENFRFQRRSLGLRDLAG